HAWKESRFGDAKQEAEDVEGEHAVYEHHRRGDDSPGHEDPRHPDARTDALHDEIAGYFENEISDEENSRSQSEYLRIEVQCLIELKRRKSDVDPIQVRHDVQQEHERDQAPRELG